MLAVESTSVRRPWDILSAERWSMLDTSKAWYPSPSPAFRAEAVSPAVQSPLGALMRQRPAQPPPKRSGGSKARGGTLEEAFLLEGSSGRIFSRVANSNASNNTKSGGSGGITRSYDSKGNVGSSSRSNNIDHPGNKEHCLLGDQSRAAKAHGVRAERSNTGGGGAGIKGQGGTCSEAWGSSAVAGAKGAECTQNKGGSSRGGKSVMSSDIWAWTGICGYETRGNVMLSAYGLQLNKQTPPCPSGISGKGTARHDRWQCNIRGVGHRESRGAGTEDGREKGGVGKDERRNESDVGGGGSRRSCDRPARIASGQGRGFRVVKAQKHPLSISSCKLSPTSRRSGHHSSVGGKEEHARATGESGPREEGRLVVLTTAASPPKSVDGAESREARVESNGRRIDCIKRTEKEDLDVLTCESPFNEVRSTSELLEGCQAHGDHTAIAVPTVSVSGQVVETLRMDGRGGTAAPPHRPHRLTLAVPAASASYATVFPDLIATGGAEDGIIGAFGSDRSRDQGPRWGDADCGDETNGVLSRPPVRSHYLPWNARKHSRDHSHYNHKARSFAGEGALRSGARPGTSTSSESAAADTARSFGEARAGFLSPRVSPKETGAIEPSVIAPPSALIDRERAEVAFEPGAAENTGEEVFVREFGFDPLNRLLHGSTTTITANYDVVEHFNQAPRPASRRGTRRRGGEGDATPPESALCLFSGPRGDRSGRAGGSMICA